MGKKVSLRRTDRWTTQLGKKIDLDIIPSNHLLRIERWLRGCGATEPDYRLTRDWLYKVRLEINKRGLSILADHPATAFRPIRNIQDDIVYKLGYNGEVISSYFIQDGYNKLRLYVTPDCIIPKPNGRLYCTICERELVENENANWHTIETHTRDQNGLW